MTVRLISVGKRHDAAIAAGIDEYTNRLTKYGKPEWVLLSPVHSPNKEQQIDYESTAIMGRIKPDDYVILLDENGTLLDTPGLAQRLEKITSAGSSTIVFVIGGAYGVNQALKNRANFTWSLSLLVFPHQLVRLILTEQLYRAFSLNAGHPYHHQ